MFGSNIQGIVVKDQDDQIWFTTYEALHQYNPKKDRMTYRFIISREGDTIRDNYRAFSLIGNELYIKAGDGLYGYDLVGDSTIDFWDINLRDYGELNLKQEQGLILFAGGYNNFQIIKLNPGSDYAKLDITPIGVSSMVQLDEHIWLGGRNGTLYHYNWKERRLLDSFTIATTELIGAVQLSKNQLLLSYFRDEFTVFDLDLKRIVGVWKLQPRDECRVNPSLFKPYIDQDSTLWVGSNGQGVLFYNLKKKKLEHFLDGTDVTKLLVLDERNFIVTTRRNGIMQISSDGIIQKSWKYLPGDTRTFSTRSAAWADKGNLLFTSNGKLYILDIVLGRIRQATYSWAKERLNFNQIDRLTNGKVVASIDTSFLYEVVYTPSKVILTPYVEPDDDATLLLYFKQDAFANLYISDDEKSVMVFKPDEVTKSHHYFRTLPIAGGVWSISSVPGDPLIYLTNTRGLFKINTIDWSYSKIEDPDHLLSQVIYTSLPDARGSLWLGTNKGLVRYDPATNLAKVFSMMDGIQGTEYNSHVALKTPDGHMFFGGVNGLNYFHPDDVHLSDKPAPIYISELLVNDEPDSTYRVPQYVDTIVLPYARNTVSFEFHAIDYSDPEATRVRYKLIGVDHDYLESKEAQGFARYANLRPGRYTFSILGANSDGVWNETPREISISIQPPFWMTWWFIMLAGSVLAGGSYSLIRSYYKRKLEKKNQLLREQALIIEKQQAVEQERTRIASEMHDDLGSGLTTIRYLSDKALRQAKDEDEVKQIKKIADHSNSLVRNMSEIIWAMNSRFDTAVDLISYLRRYASEYLGEHQIQVEFHTESDSEEDIAVSGEKRRNLFLVFKELLHNSVKYAGADKIRIYVNTTASLEIRISEIGGKGFDPHSAKEKGNGLYNCEKRMKTIGGQIQFEKTQEGMDIQFSAPLSA